MSQSGGGVPLAERAGGPLDARSGEVLRVTRGPVTSRVNASFPITTCAVIRVPAPELAELLEVVHGEVVAREVQHDVLQGAGVPVAQHEAVERDPSGHQLADGRVAASYTGPR